MPDQTQVSILRAGVQSWNAWRERNPRARIDLVRLEAPEINLAKANLTQANLSHSDLTRANLSRSDLEGADLTGAILTGASLDEANCNRGKFRYANLMNATLHGAKLAGADLRDSSFKNAKLNGAALQNARLNKADLRGANLAGAHLAGAHLSAVNAAEAVFIKANLQNADCQGAYFTRSNMALARMMAANFSTANLSNVILKKAHLSNANLFRANLYRANAAGANLSNAMLLEADLLQAEASEADFSGAKLVRANLTETDLRMANLQSATLDSCTLHRTKLWETMRAGWSVRNVACDIVFWDQSCTEATEYEPGEFARLHADNSSIELIYEGGITRFEINTLPLLLNRLATQRPDCSFRLRSIAECPGGTRVEIVVEAGDVNHLRDDALQLQEFQLRARLNEEHAHRVERMMSNMVSEFFGAIPRIVEAANVKQVNINAPIGAYIDGGTQHRVTVEQNANDISAIREVVSDVLQHRGELKLPADQAKAMDDALGQLQEQLSRPDGKGAYGELLHSLRTVLEHAVAVVVAHGEVPEWLSGVVHKIGSIIEPLHG